MAGGLCGIAASRYFATSVEAGCAFVDGEDDIDQGGKRLGQVWVGDLIPRSSTLWFGGDESAPAQASEVIGDVGPGEFEILGEFGRVARTLEQAEQDS